jgi:hypothetical protein
MDSSDYVLTHEGETLVFQATRPGVGLPTCDITAEEIHTGERVYLWGVRDAYRVVTVTAYTRLCRFHFGSPDPLKDPFTNKAFEGPIYTVTALVRTSTGEPDRRVSPEVAAARAVSLDRFMGGGAPASALSAAADALSLEAFMARARKEPVFRVAASAATAATAAARFAGWLATKVASMCEAPPPRPYAGGAGMFGIHPPRRGTRQRRRRHRRQSRQSRRM